MPVAMSAFKYTPPAPVPKILEICANDHCSLTATDHPSLPPPHRAAECFPCEEQILQTDLRHSFNEVIWRPRFIQIISRSPSFFFGWKIGRIGPDLLSK